MRLYNVRGKLTVKNVTRYLIKWDGECKSKIQFKTKQFLKPFWKGHIVYEEFPVYGTLLRVDILNATNKIAVEVNGPQHEGFHYFHNGNPFEYLNGVKRDVQKVEWLQKNGFRVVELRFDEIDTLSKQFFKDKFNILL